jgi:hypothetical protein
MISFISLFFSAPPLRSLRLCGLWESANFAETQRTQRKRREKFYFISKTTTVAIGSGADAGNLTDKPPLVWLTVNDCFDADNKYARLTGFPIAGTTRFPSLGQLKTCR